MCNGVADWLVRYNEGNTVLGMEFGNHIGDWFVSPARIGQTEGQAGLTSAGSIT